MIMNRILAVVLSTLIAIAPAPFAPAVAQIGPVPGIMAMGTPFLSTGFTGALDCTGGTITTSGVNRIHTFTSGGTLTCNGSGTTNYVVVGGGGGGGSAGGGGGGAGGFLSGSISLTVGSFTITVGAGGTPKC